MHSHAGHHHAASHPLPQQGVAKELSDTSAGGGQALAPRTHKRSAFGNGSPGPKNSMPTRSPTRHVTLHHRAKSALIINTNSAGNFVLGSTDIRAPDCEISTILIGNLT
jgi:hypothetical protein